VTHILLGLRGAWLVLMGQTKRGFACFDASKNGVWRSFTVFFFIVPFYGALLLKDGKTTLEGFVAHGFLLIVLVEGIIWLVYPLIMRNVAQALQRTNRFMLFVAARNWTRALRVMLMHVVFLLMPTKIGDASGEPVLMISPFMAFVLLVTVIMLVRYQWLVAKEALSIHGGQAAMVVVLEMMVDVCGALFLQVYVHDLVSGHQSGDASRAV